MSTRIRYEKTYNPDILTSIRTFESKTTGDIFLVYLNIKEMTYNIKNITKKRAINGGDKINNLHVLKRNVKSRLEQLGVDFNIEIRKERS